MKVRPITRNAALRWVAEVHRHLRRPVTGWLFGAQILDGEGRRIGVAMAAENARSKRETKRLATVETLIGVAGDAIHAHFSQHPPSGEAARPSYDERREITDTYVRVLEHPYDKDFGRHLRGELERLVSRLTRTSGEAKAEQTGEGT